MFDATYLYCFVFGLILYFFVADLIDSLIEALLKQPEKRKKRSERHDGR